MQIVSKTLLICGLVITTSPLCFMAQAQRYVDLEAERAAAQAAGRDPAPPAQTPPADPYGAQPAKVYPATTYGVSTGPVDATSAAPAPVAGVQRQASGQNLGNLFYQLQQLQQEVMRLNGKVEEQAHALRQLQEQSRQRYVDIDKRLSSGAALAPGDSADNSVSSGSGGPAAGVPVAGAVADSRRPTSTSAVAEQPGEGDAYNAAYALVLGRQFQRAIPAFQQFLRQFPDGKYAPNAHYWLGELYLVLQPQDLEASRQAFALLISQYPDHNKTPDALYKLGTVQFMKGNREKAREYLDLVISQYSGSNNAVVKLARDFIAENY